MRRWLIKEEAKFPSLYRNECLIGRGGRKEAGNSDSNDDNGLLVFVGVIISKL